MQPSRVPTIQTVLGPIDASQLGVTLSHEHVLVGMGEDNHHYPWLFDWDATRDNAIRELSEAKAGGIDTIIDLTTPDLGRDVEFVRDVAEASGMHVVVATGIWRDVPRSFWARDLDEHRRHLRARDRGRHRRHRHQGRRDQGRERHGRRHARGRARPARRRARAATAPAARSARTTGRPSEVGPRQVEIFLEEGAPMDRVCIGHSADTTDVDYLESLLRDGRVPVDGPLPRRRRPARTGASATPRVKALIDRGWAHRMMLGHDHAPGPVSAAFAKSGAKRPTEQTRYLFVSTTAIPALRDDGVPQETIDVMMRDVPRRFLSGEP